VTPCHGLSPPARIGTSYLYIHTTHPQAPKTGLINSDWHGTGACSSGLHSPYQHPGLETLDTHQMLALYTDGNEAKEDRASTNRLHRLALTMSKFMYGGATASKSIRPSSHPFPPRPAAPPRRCNNLYRMIPRVSAALAETLSATHLSSLRIPCPACQGGSLPCLVSLVLRLVVCVNSSRTRTQSASGTITCQDETPRRCCCRHHEQLPHCRLSGL
jgi:hypothetical protein